MTKVILGHNPIYSFEADPFVIKRNNTFFLYNHDLIGIKEYKSNDGISFKFQRYVVFCATRPFVDGNNLYFEKITSYKNFPFYKSEIRVIDLVTRKEKTVVNSSINCCCPTIIDGKLFYSTEFKQMDHGLCEPTKLCILNGPKIVGLDNISSIRKFGNLYLGTLIEQINGKSFAKIVECLPIKFPNKWKIGRDYLTASEISPKATHVYIPSIVDNLLYINVRYGRHTLASEKIFVKQI